MIGRIISTILFVIGAVVCYGAKAIGRFLYKDNLTDEKILGIKMAGYGVVLVALLILFTCA